MSLLGASGGAAPAVESSGIAAAIAPTANAAAASLRRRRPRPARVMPSIASPLSTPAPAGIHPWNSARAGHPAPSLVRLHPFQGAVIQSAPALPYELRRRLRRRLIINSAPPKPSDTRPSSGGQLLLPVNGNR